MNIGYFIVLICFFISLIPCFIIATLFYPFALVMNTKIVKILQRFVMTFFIKALILMNYLFFNIKYIDFDKVNTKKQNIYLANHQTYLDLLLGYISNDKNYTSLVANYIKYIPVIGSTFWLMGFSFTKSKGSGQVNQIIDHLKNNSDNVLVLFPEGKRHFDREFKFDRLPKRLSTGRFVIASGTTSDIIPIYRGCLSLACYF